MYKVHAKKEGGKARDVNMMLDRGIILGQVKDRFAMDFIGETSFEEALNNLANGLYTIMRYTEDKTDGKSHDEIYTRVNQAVSLILDKFDPEKKHEGYGSLGILTDEDIKKAEEKKLNDYTKER